MEMMLETRHLWLFFAITLICLVAYAVAALFSGKRSRQQKPGADESVVVIARVRRFVETRQFANLLRQQRLRFISGTAVIGFGILLAAFVAAQPIGTIEDVPEIHTRDIVLCLDVSGSMLYIDEKIVNTYMDIIKKFKGERVSLVAWNTTAVSIFPLTNDKDYMIEQLKDMNKEFKEGLGDIPGTYSDKSEGSSLIGDGLAACAYSLDTNNDRGRTVIFASDGDLAGTEIITAKEAAGIAKRGNTTVHVITPDVNRENLQDIAKITGGTINKVDGADSVSKIVDAIEKTEYKRMVEDAPRVFEFDKPMKYALLLFALVTALVFLPHIIARVRR